MGSLFAAFLGYNPVETLLGPSGVLDRLNPENAATLTGPEFFPNLVSGPFHDGLVVVFTVAAVMSVVAAIASLARGQRFVHQDRVEVVVAEANRVLDEAEARGEGQALAAATDRTTRGTDER